MTFVQSKHTSELQLHSFGREQGDSNNFADILRSGNILPLFSPLPPPHPVPCAVAHEHLKERSLFGLPHPPPGASPADYYHQMAFMASHPNPYGDLLMQSGAAAGATHLHDYLSPVDGE